MVCLRVHSYCSDWRKWEVGCPEIVVKLRRCLSLGLISPDHIMLQLLNHGLERSLRTHAGNLQPLPYPQAVIDYYLKLDFHGGAAVINLLTGPGMHGKGAGVKGMAQHMFHWADHNLGGPSNRTLTANAPDCPTRAGINRDCLVIAITVINDPARKIPPLVRNTTVRVDAIAEPSDAMQIKPSLCVDQRNGGAVIGLVDGPLDAAYCAANPNMPPSRLKSSLVTDFIAILVRSLFSDVWLPVGTMFKGKSKSAEQWLSDFKRVSAILSSCLLCCKDATNIVDHVLLDVPVRKDTPCTTTACQHCTDAKVVCAECKAKGHTRVEVNLRACDSCVAAGVLCTRLAPLFAPADCEAYQNTGMEMMLKQGEDNTANTLYSLVLPAPDAIHVAGRIKNAAINWWIVGSHEQRINLYILRVLTHHGSLEVQRRFREVLPAADTTFRDRMSYSALLRMSAQRVRQLVEQFTAFAVPYVPAIDYFWKTNRPSAISMPTSICAPEFGFIAFTDLIKGQLLMADNHQPCNVSVIARDLIQPDCVTCSAGLLVFVELGRESALRFVDIAQSWILDPSSMTVPGLRDALRQRGRPTSGKKAELAKRLSDYLSSLPGGDRVRIPEWKSVDSKADAVESEQVPWAKDKTKTRPSLPVHSLSAEGLPSGSTVRALLLGGNGKVLIVSAILRNDSQPMLHFIDLECNGLALTGRVSRSVSLQPGAVVRGLTWGARKEKLLFADMGLHGGIFQMDMKTLRPVCLVSNNAIGATSGPVQPYSIARIGSDVLFSDVALLQILRLSPSGKVDVVCGSGRKAIINGVAGDSAFAQPTGICCEGSTVYVADAAGRSIRLIVTQPAALTSYLKHLHKLPTMFGAHLEGKQAQQHSLAEATAYLGELLDDLRSWNSFINISRGKSKDARVQGPDGGVPSQIVRSVDMLLGTLNQAIQLLTAIHVDLVRSVRLSSLLTINVEFLFSLLRSRNATPDIIECCQMFMGAVLDLVRRMTRSHFHVFTGGDSHYVPPDSPAVSLLIDNLELCPKTSHAKPSPDILSVLNGFAAQGKSQRQKTVRQETTKSKPGTLPLAAHRADPVPGQQHDFSAVDLLLEEPIHALNEHFVANQWLALRPECVPQMTSPCGDFLIGRCVDDHTTNGSQFNVRLFASLPPVPTRFRLVSDAEYVLRKSAAFHVVAAESISPHADDEDVWELDGDGYHVLIDALHSDHSDGSSLEEEDRSASADDDKHVQASGKRRRARKAKSKSIDSEADSKVASEGEDESKAEAARVDDELKSAVANDLHERMRKGEPFAYISDIVKHLKALEGFDGDREQQLRNALDVMGIPCGKRGSEVNLTHPDVRAKCGATIKRTRTQKFQYAKAGRSLDSSSADASDKDYSTESDDSDVE